MPDVEPEDPSHKGQDFFQIFLKAKEFTEELLKENERLRFRIAQPRDRRRRGPPTSGHGAAAADPDLEERLAEMEARFKRVEDENKEFADRYIEIEEQNNNLANLYVA